MLYSAVEKVDPISLDMACNQILSSIVCSFELTNNAKEDYYLLKHGTPLEGFRSPFIAVFHSDHLVKYQGPYFYRLPPTKDDFVLIQAGNSISATIQITDVFNFSSDGLYIIQYRNPLRVLTGEDMELQSITSGKIQETKQIKISKAFHITVKDSHRISSLIRRKLSKGDIVSIEHCGKIKLIGGSEKARNETIKAHKRLCNGYRTIVNKLDELSDTFKTYFSIDYTHVDRVTSTYQSSLLKIHSNVIAYDFTGPHCTEGVYAYTYKDTARIYLCELYTEDPIECMSYHSSKEGVLVNMLTIAFGFTQDFTSNADESAQLLHSFPYKTLINAKSYELFYCQSMGKEKVVETILIPETFM